MDDMLKDFVVEALELATNVEEHLLTLERHPDDLNTLNAVFRSFHTIKGGAGFMNLPAMVSACHLTENLFDALRNGKAPVTPIAIEAALQASGFVADQLTELATAPPRKASRNAGGAGKNPDQRDRRQGRADLEERHRPVRFRWTGEPRPRAREHHPGRAKRRSRVGLECAVPCGRASRHYPSARQC